MGDKTFIACDFSKIQFFIDIAHVAWKIQRPSVAKNFDPIYNQQFGKGPNCLLRQMQTIIPAEEIDLSEITTKQLHNLVNIYIRKNHEMMQQKLDEIFPDFVLIDFLCKPKTPALELALKQISEFIKSEMTSFLDQNLLKEQTVIRSFFNKTFQYAIEQTLKSRLFSLQDLQENTFLSYLINGLPVQEFLPEGFERIFTKLIQLGFDFQTPNNKKVTCLDIMRSKFPQNVEQIDALVRQSSEFLAGTVRPGGAKGTIALMGAACSPADHIAVVKKQGGSYSTASPNHYDSAKTEVLGLRPGAFTPLGQTFVTPQKTPLNLIWEINLNEKTESLILQIFVDDRKTRFADAVENINVKTITPLGLKTDILHDELTANLSEEIIKRWQGKKREMTQKAVMGATAYEAALAVGLQHIGSERSWQWCHLIAHSMGGPINTSIIIQDPQIPENLVLGTTEANAQMLIIESAAKQIASHIHKLNVRVFPEFTPGYEKYSFAHYLKYFLEDPENQRAVIVNFNMLSGRKVFEQEIPIITQEITAFFTNGLQLKQLHPASSSTIGASQVLLFGGPYLIAPAQNTTDQKLLQELEEKKKEIMSSIDAIGAQLPTNKKKHDLLLELYTIEKNIEQTLAIAQPNTDLTSIIAKTPLTELKEKKREIISSIDAIGTKLPTNKKKHDLLLELYTIEKNIEILAAGQPNAGVKPFVLPKKTTFK